VYRCYPGLAAQHWYFTADNRLAITGGTQCLDLGNNATGKTLQTYTCTSGDINQVWTPDTTPTSTATLAPTPTSPPTPTPTTVQYIHPNGNSTLCLSYYEYDGGPVNVGTCGSSQYPSDFMVNRGDNLGIYVAGTNL
jgi:hypothetical protein